MRRSLRSCKNLKYMKINSALKNRLKKAVLAQLRHPEAREVVVKSAYPMTQIEVDKLKTSATFLKEAKVVNQVDTSLIGGLIILDGSRIIDVSIKGKLDEIIDSLL